MRQHETLIGVIDSVSGNIVTVKRNGNFDSNMPIIDGTVYKIGVVGSFLKIPLGYATLYGVVTQVGSNAMPDYLKENDNFDGINSSQWITIVLIGENVGRKFDRGITQYPTSGDQVHIVTKEDMARIYGVDGDSYICIGSISNCDELEAKIDLDKLVTRHSAILGSTGSGKSNAVSVIINALSKLGLNSKRVLLIDPHGEYSHADRERKNVFRIHADITTGEKELFIPFWALPFNELLSIFSVTLSEQQREYVQDKVVSLKKNVASTQDFGIETNLINADTPIPFSIKKMWFELDDFERMTLVGPNRNQPAELLEVGDQELMRSNVYPPAGIGMTPPFLNNSAKGIRRFLDSVKSKVLDTRYSFLFTPGDFCPDINGVIRYDLDDFLYSWISGGENVTILDLSGVPSEITEAISGALIKIIYDFIVWGQDSDGGGRHQPILFILEEAHRYLKAGDDSISSITVQTIAKEGRKYGVGLMLVTQRPSEINETVLSQCGTIIALRMNNGKDRSHIAEAMQDELKGMVDLLPTVRTGECIISGESIQIPSRIRFFRATNMGKSSDPQPSVQWKQPIASKVTYKAIIKKWRNQKN